MHDANGTLLKKGDRVLFPATIIELDEQPDYCNVTIEGDLPRRPDGLKERETVNTGSLIKFTNAPGN